MERLNQLKLDRIADINEEELLSAEEKSERILDIEKEFADRRVAVEEAANQAKKDSFNAVVTNFTAGIGRMVAAQLRLRAVQGLTDYLIGAQGAAGGGLLGRLFGGAGGAASGAAFLANPFVGLGVLAGSAILTQLFSGSFHDPINDALARQAGQRQSVLRAASVLGRESAADLQTNFDQGFVQGTQRIANQQSSGTARASDQPILIQLEVTTELDGVQLAKTLNSELIRLEDQNLIVRR